MAKRSRKRRLPLFRWRKLAKRADNGRWCSMAHAIANPKTTMVLRVRFPVKVKR